MRETLRPYSLIHLSMVLSLTVSITVKAEAGPATLPDNTHIHIATADWPPLIHEQGQEDSPLLQIISESFTDAAYSTAVHFAPWSRAYVNVRDSIWDTSPGWDWNEERDREVLFSDAVFPFYQVFFHLKSQPIEWTTFEDLKPYRIGGTQDFNYGDDYKMAESSNHYKIERAPTDTSGFQKLLKGRIDLQPMNIWTGYAIAKQTLTPEEFAQLTHHSRPITPLRGSHLIFAKTPLGEKYRDAFNRGLHSLRESGRLEALLDKARPSQLRELWRLLTASPLPPIPGSDTGGK